MMLSIFILPPSNKELHERLKKRAEDSSETVSKRICFKARSEISHWIEYDYVLINDNLENCSSDVLTFILNAEKKKKK